MRLRVRDPADALSVGAFGIFLIGGLISTAFDPTSETVVPDLLISPDGVVVRLV